MVAVDALHVLYKFELPHTVSVDTLEPRLVSMYACSSFEMNLCVPGRSAARKNQRTTHKIPTAPNM